MNNPGNRALLALDIAQAFDSVQWHYLWAVLKKNLFDSLIHLLYVVGENPPCWAFVVWQQADFPTIRIHWPALLELEKSNMLVVQKLISTSTSVYPAYPLDWSPASPCWTVWILIHV